MASHLKVEEVVCSTGSLEASSRDDTTAVFGKTFAGRCLVVLLSEAEDGRGFIITARDMTEAEKRTFRKRGDQA